MAGTGRAKSHGHMDPGSLLLLPQTSGPLCRGQQGAQMLSPPAPVPASLHLLWVLGRRRVGILLRGLATGLGPTPMAGFPRAGMQEGRRASCGGWGTDCLSSASGRMCVLSRS